jgi:cell division protein ZapE
MLATPQQVYQHALASGELNLDQAQEQAVNYTQQLYEDLLNNLYEPKLQMLDLWSKLLGYKKHQPQIKGLYLWGGVGRGKTYILDNFYASLPFEQKKRLHFHRFMQHIHDKLNQLNTIPNPLENLAADLAQHTKVLCLDEFHVADITDAMLLDGLLRSLFAHGVTLVTTSNVHPDDLYSGGLQRERFLPAIALLKTSTHVINVDNGIDYRLKNLTAAKTYYYPMTANNEQSMADCFAKLAPDQPNKAGYLTLYGRDIPTIQIADGVIWFEFAILCHVPRGTADYIEIAQDYHTVFVSNIPSMGDAENDLVLRLIHLVDEFYDRGVKLIISSPVPAELLYTGNKLKAQFQRTISRLLEMQSTTYLAKPHLP